MRQISIGLKRRDQRFFNKCIEASLARNRARAVMYANECAEVRKLAQLIISSELAVEQAVLRLQTVSELSDVMVAVAPIIGIVQETKGRLAGIIPNVAGSLDDVNSMLRNSLQEMSANPMSGNGLVPSSKEAMQVLDAANVAAEEKVREKFPVLPPEIVSQEIAETRIPVALTAGGGSYSRVKSTGLKNEVFKYIETCDGRISIMQCASYLGIFPDDVENAILNLKKEGKIAMA